MDGLTPTPEDRLIAAGATVRKMPRAAPQFGRFTLLSSGACIHAPPRGYILKGLIAPGDLVIWFGPPGSAKSVLAPYVAHAIAAGRRIFGRRVRKGPVLYVAAEDGPGMKLRVWALHRVYGEASGLFVVADAVDLMGDGIETPADLASLRAAAKHIGAVMIVVDTIARAFPGLDENDARSMGRAVRVLRDLGAPDADDLPQPHWPGAAVLAVHHGAKGADGKGGPTPRGHGVLNGDADLTLRFQAGEAGAPRTAVVEKNRNGPSYGQIAFTLRLETLEEDEDGDPIVTPVAEEVEEDTRQADAVRNAERRLNPRDTILIREIRSLAADAELTSPEPGMPRVRAVSRASLRRRLIASGWFPEGELATALPEGAKPNDAGYRAENKALTKLKSSGLAGFNRTDAWAV